MDGSEKLKPIMIEKSIKNYASLALNHFRWITKQKKKAWITAVLLEKWLKELDKKMKLQKRKNVLFIDDCTAQPSTVISLLKSERVKFIPPNKTLKLQPLDQGII